MSIDIKKRTVKPDIMEEPATEKNFDEAAYLLANPDVAQAVREDKFESGRSHFEVFGRQEGRMLQRDRSIFLEAKKVKLRSIASLLRSDMSHREDGGCYDFLTQELRAKFNIVDTDAVSSHGYDAFAMEIVNKHRTGWVLDCVAGKRPVYFDNVVNFEIAYMIRQTSGESGRYCHSLTMHSTLFCK